MAEKKPWLSPYHYCSNNPINRIDPDGRVDYFNSKGAFERSTKIGSNIQVNIGGEYKLLSEVNLSSQENRQVVANTIGHYLADAGISVYAKGMIPMGDSPRGTAGLNFKDDPNTIAFAREQDIWVNKDGDQVKSIINDKYNLINTLVHEGEHKNQNYSNSTLKGGIREIKAIETQMNHSSYSKTTKEFQKNTMGYLIKGINSVRMNDNNIIKTLENANSKNKHYQIVFERYGGGADSYTLKIIEKKGGK